MATAAHNRCDEVSVPDNDLVHDFSRAEETLGSAPWVLRHEAVFREAVQEEMKAAMERLTRRFNLAEAWAQHYLREALDSVPLQTANSNKLR